MIHKGANPVAGYRAVGSKVIDTYTYYFFVDNAGNTLVERQLTAGGAVHTYYFAPSLDATAFAALFSAPQASATIVYANWFEV